jgi:hypothetical protein
VKPVCRVKQFPDVALLNVSFDAVKPIAKWIVSCSIL